MRSLLKFYVSKASFFKDLNYSVISVSSVVKKEFSVPLCLCGKKNSLW